MDTLTAFGLAVTMMLVCYALEDREPVVCPVVRRPACALGSAYGSRRAPGRSAWWRRSGQSLPCGAGSAALAGLSSPFDKPRRRSACIVLLFVAPQDQLRIKPRAIVIAICAWMGLFTRIRLAQSAVRHTSASL